MIHGYWVVLFAEELGWQMLPTIWTGFRPTDRFFMKDCGHVSLLINELEFPPNFNFAACVYCRKFGAISGFHRFELREDLQWNCDEAKRLSQLLHRSNFAAKTEVAAYIKKFPFASEMSKLFLKRLRGKCDGPPVKYFHQIEANGPLIQEVWNDIANDWIRDATTGQQWILNPQTGLFTERSNLKADKTEKE